MVLLGSCLLGVSSIVSAQGIAAPRAPQGVFGAIRQDTVAKTRLDLTASLIEGYDDDIPTQVAPTFDANATRFNGLWTMLNASGSYFRAGKNASIAASAGSDVRYYRDQGETRILGENAGLGAQLRLPSKTTLELNQAMTYSPTFLYSLFLCVHASDIPPHHNSVAPTRIHATAASLADGRLHIHGPKG
jgi:hypothetical protein